MIVWLAIIFAIVFLDQLSKWLIVTYLPEGGITIINGILRFTYVENTGAAFGMLSDKRWIFITLSIGAIIFMLCYLVKHRSESRLLSCSLAFIVGGGIGNMIDRILLGYVVDFIDFCAFPKLWVWVFNIADAFICIGAGLLILYLIILTVKEAREAKTAADSLKQAKVGGASAETADISAAQGGSANVAGTENGARQGSEDNAAAKADETFKDSSAVTAGDRSSDEKS